MDYQYLGHIITVVKSDITQICCDVIVNSAQPSLLPGDGISSTIFLKGGKKIIDACKKIGGCATGDSKITVAGDLLCHYIIHAVGPLYSSSSGVDLLRSCYIESMHLANEYCLYSIAFSSISTGANGYPPEEASRIAIDTILKLLPNVTSKMKILFCVFDDRQYDLYDKLLKEHLK